jgi:K+-transporting ATPase KdpF subunit
MWLVPIGIHGAGMEIICLVATLALAIYLVVALLQPEKFQ